MITFNNTFNEVFNRMNDLYKDYSFHPVFNKLNNIIVGIKNLQRTCLGIVLHAMPKVDPGKALLFTQEIDCKLSEKQFKGFEHFIFFSDRDEEIDKTAFAVAHELGHIFLHCPGDKHNKQRISLPFEQGVLFETNYTNREEVEADIFAAIVMYNMRVRDVDFVTYFNNLYSKGYFLNHKGNDKGRARNQISMSENKSINNQLSALNRKLEESIFNYGI